MKFSSALLGLSLVASSQAFAPSVFGSVSASSLYATIEKREISAPVRSGDTQESYGKHIQTTYGRYPLTVSHGKGTKLFTTDGKEYLDFVSGIATCALGHSNEALTKAVVDQMNAVHHCSNLYFIPAQAQLAEWLCANSVADKVFFCNSGAEANEAAIKLARKHASNRGITDPFIISAKQSFHGRTLAALSATAQPKYHKGFTFGGEMVQGFVSVEYNNVEELEEMVAKINKTPNDLKLKGRKQGVAAIMMEALQGEGGIIPGNPLFFMRARQLADECGALLICDEVQVGMGRSGLLWGYEQLSVEPDVFTSAKALGGGVPIGAMMARGAIADTFQPGDHASTYGGNPLACAAGLAVASEISEKDLLANVRERGEQLSAGLEKIAEKYPKILGSVRGWGLLKGIVVQPEAGCTAGELVGEAMTQGLLLVPAGPTVVRFVPPLNVSEDEIDAALAFFEKAVAIKAEVAP